MFRTTNAESSKKTPKQEKTAWDDNVDFTLDSDAALWAFEDA